jgi:hypothetical protein
LILVVAGVLGCNKDSKEAAEQVEEALDKASGPEMKESGADAKREVARAQARELASSAFMQWKAKSRGMSSCPVSIDALLEYTNMNDANDPWGTPFELLCGASAPRNAPGGVGVRSAGPDRKTGTDDDVHSW